VTLNFEYPEGIRLDPDHYLGFKTTATSTSRSTGWRKPTHRCPGMAHVLYMSALIRFSYLYQVSQPELASYSAPLSHSFLTFRGTIGSMATTTPSCGWVMLSKCNKKCWFADTPPPDDLVNYIDILDDFGASLAGNPLFSSVPHLMVS